MDHDAPALLLAIEGSGIGATIRLKSGGRSSPAREIHAGSGYWSQDSAVQVLGLLPEPMQIWVRWPGGQTNTFEVPRGARDIEVSPAGKLTVRP